VIALLPGLVTAQAPPPDFDEGLFDIVVTRELSGALIVLQNRRGEVLLPVLPVLQLTELPYEHDSPGRLQVRSSGEMAVVDLETLRLELPDTVIEIDPDRLIAAYDDLYLPGPLLARLIDAEVDVDFGLLTLRVSRDPPFPSQIRLQRERERARAERVAGRVLGERDLPRQTVPYPATTGGGTLEWGVNATGADDLPDAGSVRGRLGLALWGGELFLGGLVGFSGLTGVTPAAEGLFSYRRVFPENRWLQQLQVGDLLTEGVRRRPVTGIQLSNVPVVRDRRFDDVVLDLDLPEGWQYELYQGGILLGASTPDAAEPLRVPLTYGATPLRIRYLGPQGEERIAEVTNYVPVGQLARGRTEYAVGAGACRGLQCDFALAADLRHGVTSRLTLSGGMEAERDSLAVNRWRPYVAASALPLRNLLVESSVLPGGFARGAVRYSHSPRAVLSTEGGVERPGFRSGSLLPEETDRWFVRTEGRAPLCDGLGPVRSLRASLRTEGRLDSAAPTRIRAAVAGSVRGGFVELRHERSDLQPEAITAIRGSSSALTRRAPFRAYRPMISGGVGASRSGIAQADAGVSLSITDRTRFRAAGSWTRGIGPPRLTVGLSTETNAARLRSGMTTGATTRTTLGADGMLSYGPGVGLRADARRGAGLAGIEGRVFHDLSGDGAYGPGDAPVASIPVIAGGRRVVTDEDGRFRVWGVRPYEISTISIDSARIADPSWIASDPAYFVRPVPNVYTRVDIPLVRTREIFGEVVTGDGMPSPGGVTILILTVDDEEEVLRVRTFSDGSFYVPRIRPGTYRIRVAESSLRALGAAGVEGDDLFAVPHEGFEPVEVRTIRFFREDRQASVPASRLTTGRLVSAVDALPVVGEVAVRLDSTGETVARTFTEEDGSFAVSIPGERVTFLASARGFRTHSAPANPEAVNRLALVPLAADSVQVPFAFDRYTLGPSGMEAVERAVHLAKGTVGAVDIRGHTDAEGADAYNVRLSRNRAQTVARVLTDLGVAEERILIRGFGPFRPLKPNRTASGKAANRRVEVVVVKDEASR
jgi:hypothetical protein